MPAKRATIRRQSWRRWIALAVLVTWVAFRIWQSWKNQPPAPAELLPGEYAVERAVDGDTILLANRIRVRLIGVDTPESVTPEQPVEPWGPEAADFTRRQVADKSVRLELDEERTDRHGRLLAYVWVGDQLLNEELIRAGLGKATLGYHFSDSKKALFRAAQREAQVARRGIWSDAPPSGSALPADADAQ